MAEGMADYLRHATRDAHEGVRLVPIVKAYFKGRLTDRLLMEGLAALSLVYGELERALEDRGELASLRVARVLRTQRIDEDLEALQALGLPQPEGPFEEACRYAERIREVSLTDPRRLAAHAYARYMGDLVGGPIAAKVAPRVLPVPAGYRLRYLDLAEAPDLSTLRRNYRGAVDDLPGDWRDVLEEEVRHAFRLHKAMSGELWRRYVD